MLGFDKLDKHADLVGRMGETLGIDVVTEVQRGNLNADELRTRVFRCVGCTDPVACGHWMDDHAETGATATPDYCRNAEMFDRLAHLGTAAR